MRFIGPDDLVFRAAEGKTNFLYRMKTDGSGRARALADAVLELGPVSTDGQWLTAWAAAPGIEATSALFAYPIDGGPRVRLCETCAVYWSASGRHLYVSFGSPMNATVGSTFVVPLANGRSF